MAAERAINDRQKQAATWFRSLRDKICAEFELIEKDFGGKPGSFERKNWERPA